MAANDQGNRDVDIPLSGATSSTTRLADSWSGIPNAGPAVGRGRPVIPWNFPLLTR